MDISIVTIEYFSIPDLKACLDSIKKHSANLSLEIIVVSNSCYPEDKQKELQSQFNQCTWVFSKENLGFAKGVNLGIENTTSDIITLLNVDLLLLNDLSTPFKYIKENNQIGILGPKILDSEGNVQDSARPFMTPFRAFKRILTRLFKKKDVILSSNFDYNSTQSVDWLIGAAMMISRNTLEKVGLMDPEYFLYVEDMDWCMRMEDKGYKNMYFPDWQVQYKGDRKSSIRVFKNTKFLKHSCFHILSYLRFLRKHSISLIKRALSK